LDYICCSCLLESIRSKKLPNWALDLFDYNEIKSRADLLPRSDDRFFITNGAFFIDPFYDSTFMYCPMAIFDREKIRDKIKDNMLKIYDSDNQYIFDILIDIELQNELNLWNNSETYNSTIGNLKLKIIRKNS
jgi:hypothetical protein